MRRRSVRRICSTRTTTRSRTCLGATCGPHGGARAGSEHAHPPQPPPHPPPFPTSHPRPDHPFHPNPKPHALTRPTRRAQRLSFEIWTAIREENHDLQAVLEATSTGDRLRLALLRLRALREQVKG